MKILAFGGSNSKNSINRALAYFVAEQFEDAQITKYDLSQVQIPIYSVDKENEQGIPQEVLDFAEMIDRTDLIVLSLAENNGSFNVGLKNLLDWTSRIKDRKTFNGKNLFLLATSPGARGGATVLESGKNLFPFSGANVKATFSLPSFYQNFDMQKGITNEDLFQELKTIIASISK